MKMINEKRVLQFFSLTLVVLIKLSRAQNEACHSGSTGLVIGNETGSYNGELWSAHFPDVYPPNHQCRWLITVPDGAVDTSIRLKFIAFNIHMSDPVKIYDGSTIDPNRLIFEGHGNSTPPSYITSSGRFMFVVFDSDGANNASGFRALFNSDPACTSGGRYVVTETEIQSPFYPYPYPPNFECVWNFIHPSGGESEFVFSFDYFRLAGPAGTCSGDYLEVFNNANSVKRYCAFQLKDSITEYGTALRVLFHSDSDIAYNGFSFKVDYYSNSTIPRF